MIFGVFWGIFVGMYEKLIQLMPLTKEILNLISELDEFKGRWSATQFLAPDRLFALRQIATVESVGSSTRIEGVKLTNSEIENLLRGVKNYTFKSRDEQEVAGYAELMDLIFNSHSEIQFTENYIQQLHSILLKYSDKDSRHRGSYKKFPNNVEAFDHKGKSKGIIFQTTTPLETPQLIKKLIDWANSEIANKDLHPLLVIATFVIVFLHIHPFQDGNGRLSRALTTLLLLKSGYTHVSYSSFERIIEEHKDAYYLALRRGQSELETKNFKKQNDIQTSGMNSWLIFFLKSMQKQKKYLEAKMSSELVTAKMPELSLQIIEFIRNHQPVSIADIVHITNANRNTIKLHVKNLVSDLFIIPEGIGRGTRYRLK